MTLPSAATFVIVRHGNTFAAGEPPRRIGALTDLPLTAKGEAQAHALGRHFAVQGCRFDSVLASPLLRTRATAEAIMAHQPEHASLKAQPCDWLREIDHGPDENQSEERVLARIGVQALADWDERAVPPPGWHVDAAPRLAAWTAFLCQSEGTVLLVTSNGAARFALLAAGLAEGPTLKLATGAYGVIGRNETGAFHLISWGLRP